MAWGGVGVGEGEGDCEGDEDGAEPVGWGVLERGGEG